MGRSDPSKISVQRTHLTNFGWLAGTKFAADLLTFALFVALSRIYGPEGIGVYSFATAFVGFFAVVADFGLTTLMVKDMSQKSAPPGFYFGNLLVARIVLSVVNLLLLGTVAVLLFPDPVTVKAILILGTYQILYYLLDGCLAPVTAAEDMHINGLKELSLRLTIAGAGIYMAMTGFDLTTVLLAFPVMTAIHLAVVFALVARSYAAPVFDVSVAFLKEKLREAVPYALSYFFFLLYSRTDILFLGFLVGEVAVGIYNVAYRVVFGLLIVTHYLSQVFFPMASRLFEKDSARAERLYSRALRLAVLFGVPMTAGLALISDRLVILFYGHEFVSAGPILALLAGLILLGFLENMVGMFLTAGGRQVDRTRSQAWAAVTNVALNALLIPAFSVVGAAVATLTSQSLLALLYLVRLRELLGWPRIGRRLVLALVATTPFVALGMAVPDLPLWAIIPVSALLYTGGLLLSPKIRREELTTLKTLLRPERTRVA